MSSKKKTNEETQSQSLSRSISPFMLAIYGLGTVLGAGIYVVIGEIVGEAGALAPVAFLIAALAAAFTAVSYAELSVRIPESGGSSAFVARGFSSKKLTIITGWAVIATGLVSAATITTGFVGYLNVFVEVSKWWSVPILIGLLTAVAVVGVKESAWFMVLTTLAGVIGLLIVILVAGYHLQDYPELFLNTIRDKSFSAISMSVMLGCFLAFYSFIGFEDLVTLSEESKDVSRSLPIAIFTAVGGSLVFYLLVAAIAATATDPTMLAESRAPLVSIVEKEGVNGKFLGALSLAIIVNGALAQIVMAGRVIYDLGVRRGGVPHWLSKVNNRTATPVTATILCGIVVGLLALFFPTEFLAAATSFIILAVFTCTNAALISCKRKHPKPEGIKVYPTWIPIVGIILNLALIAGQTLIGGGSH